MRESYAVANVDLIGIAPSGRLLFGSDHVSGRIRLFDLRALRKPR